jgi:hypothetical protein
LEPAGQKERIYQQNLLPKVAGKLGGCVGRGRTNMSKTPTRKLKRKFRLYDKLYRKGKCKDKKRRNQKPYGGYQR